jgi:hypothetical protein
MQEREEIPALAWVDIALCEVAGDWAAAIECEHREYQGYQHNKIRLVVRRSDADLRRGVRAILPTKQRTELEGWCSLRINSADVLTVFPMPMSPTENLAVIARFLQQENQSAPTRGGGTAPAELPTGVRTNKDASAEQACETYLRNLKERPKNKDEAYVAAAAAVAHIGQLSRKAFERAWAKVAPADWKRPGRPEKRP